ncbi:MAG: transporter substrate-binding domain-containing protein [Alphaproteobacteria bacterium]
MTKDPNTGALGGLMVDYLEALGKAAQLKIEWAQEVDIATYLQDLAAGRYDAECVGGWPNAERAKLAAYTKPIAFYPLYAWVRNDDTRFDLNLSALNQPTVRIAVADGGTDAHILAAQFPAATALRIPQLSGGVTDLVMQVTTKKADVIFTDLPSMAGFNRQNPDQLRPLLNHPVDMKKITLSVAAREQQLLNFLNEVGDILVLSGATEKVLQKYETISGSFLRPAPPYSMEKN